MVLYPVFSDVMLTESFKQNAHLERFIDKSIRALQKRFVRKITEFAVPKKVVSPY